MKTQRFEVFKHRNKAKKRKLKENNHRAADYYRKSKRNDIKTQNRWRDEPN